ncbi:MAG: ferredoxin--NADP reductase [Hyphomicrobiales bacterium]
MEAVRPVPPGNGELFTTQIVSRRPLSPKAFELILSKPPKFDFTAGQRICLKHGDSERDYSIVSSPDEPEIRLCIRNVPGGLLSPQLAQAPAGLTLTFTGPHGYFTFKASSRPAVFVATGTGIAPFCAMAGSGVRGFTLLHGVAAPEDLYYHTFLQPRAAAYRACLSESEPRTAEHFAGQVTDYIATHLPRRACDFYLCGRQDMIRDVTFLVDEGFPGSFVYSETFY